MEVVDELTGDVWTIECLAPGESREFTAEYTVTEADVLAGKVVNVATANGESPDPEKPDPEVDPGEKEDPTEEKNGHLTLDKGCYKHTGKRRSLQRRRNSNLQNYSSQ